MSIAEVEGKFQLQEKKAEQAKPQSNKATVYNFVFSIIVTFVINRALRINILSHYSTDTSGEYFHCGWDGFDSYCYDSSTYKMTSQNVAWSTKYQQCTSYSQGYLRDCNSYNNPQQSGSLWYYCNIISLASLGISAIGHVVIFVTNQCSELREKYPSILQNLLFSTILFQSFLPTILLLIAIIHWFSINKPYGCWCSTFLNYRFDDSSQCLFTRRQIGESMVFDIIAAGLVGIHLMCYIHQGCNALGFGNKKRRKRRRKKKQGEPMLYEHNYNNEIAGVEHEGSNAEQMQHDIPNKNHVRIESIAEMVPGSDQMEEHDMKIENVDQNEYDSVKKWFFESVAVPQDYKQIYYDKFIENGFDNLVVLKYMNNQDLMDIGVDKLGHRKTILISTQKL